MNIFTDRSLNEKRAIEILSQGLPILMLQEGLKIVISIRINLEHETRPFYEHNYCEQIMV